ncbi:MAG TPA: heme ABC exporter ATP-binding protein CcmA [Longimicrobiales bacterium]|nr:heme ABC exporter ATP-binding protein CcmA [Longimicrobiales bacterium]
MRYGVVAEGVAKRFGRRWALRGASFRAEPGSVLALMGPNGSGKTTLLRIMSTSLRPTRGGGSVFGHDLIREADAIRAHVGVLYHAAGLYGDLTARENLEFARRMWGGQAAVSVDEALERVGLAHALNDRAAGFSSGMTRRLGLARLVMRPPLLLLLDEPYASFDADGIELVHTLVRETAARDGIVLIATHDPERSAAVVDGVLRLRDGRVIAEDAPSVGGIRLAAGGTMSIGAEGRR